MKKYFLLIFLLFPFNAHSENNFDTGAVLILGGLSLLGVTVSTNDYQLETANSEDDIASNSSLQTAGIACIASGIVIKFLDMGKENNFAISIDKSTHKPQIEFNRRF